MLWGQVIIPLAVTVAGLRGQLRAAQLAAVPRGPALSASAAAGAYATSEECRIVIPKEPSPLGTPPPPLAIKGGRIVDALNGSDVQLHGINWFGFNNGKTMVDGLDAANGSWLGGDFATVVYRLRLLGFNAVRLPFRFSDLEKPTQDYARPCAPETPLTAADIAAATMPPERAPGLTGRVPAHIDFLLPMTSQAGVCNHYLPNGPTTLPRLLWVIEYLVANRMYVLLDYHPHDSEPEVLREPAAFAARWRALAAALRCLPNYASDLDGRVLFDLLNEPDEYGMGWTGGTREHSPHGHFLLAAMDALEQLGPGTLYFIQGGGQTALGTAWGDGFVTDPETLARRGLQDANPFFRDLLARPYRSQVVLSPHFYGASITNSTLSGPALWEALSSSWGGHMVGAGYCVPDGQCSRLPVVVGEVGGRLDGDAGAADAQQLADFAAFAAKRPPTDAPAYKHERVSGWFWWAWNANSADTGGLVADDWSSVLWQKVGWLVDHLELQPWWLGETRPVPAPQPVAAELLLPPPAYSSKRLPRHTPREAGDAR